jgi:hypothetical protein
MVSPGKTVILSIVVLQEKTLKALLSLCYLQSYQIYLELSLIFFATRFGGPYFVSS